jgi:hypothetical protein
MGMPIGACSASQQEQIASQKVIKKKEDRSFLTELRLESNEFVKDALA